MSMPVFITLDDRASFNPDVLVYGVWNYDKISDVYVKGHSNGVIKIEATPGTDIKDFIEFVEGIFHPESNFASVICDYYHIPVDGFNGVRFDFNGVKFLVRKDTVSTKKMLEHWKKESKKLLKNR